jgi:hypothetical protein
LSCLLPFIPKYIRAHSVRTVIRPEIRKSQTFNSWAGKLGLCVDYSYFLIEGHALKGIIDTLLHWFALV